MESMFGRDAPAVFGFMLVLFVALSFLVVLAVRSVPNKLILLGLLVAAAGIGFGAALPGIAKLAFIMLLLAVALVMAGVLCIFVSFLVQSLKTSNASQKGPPNPS